MILVLPLLLVCISSPLAHATTSTPKSNSACSGHRVSIPLSSGAWLRLDHRHGPCSPFPSSERIPSTADVLHRDRLRADGIRMGLDAAMHGDVTIPTTLGSSLHSLEYVVTVGLGTPATNQTVLVDTGSDISWVQCRPCPVPLCHRQKDAVFNPARSATYSAIPCGSASCLGLGRDFSGGNCSRPRLCKYIVKYGDGSSTTGTYSSDKLTLSPEHSVEGFRFGCSHTARLFVDRADGLMALGGGKTSLVSQKGEKAFSYCLPPTANYSGFLTLGVPRVSSSRFVVTPMHRIRNIDTYYGVRLRGITVAGRRLGVAPSVFAAGAAMDSGTVITRLPQTAYRVLRAAFRKEMRMYQRAEPPSEIFDTCYNLTGGDVKVPSVALVFDRAATVELDPSGIIIDGCLAFASTGDDSSVGIIGNVQQRTIEVLYNIGGRAIGFRRSAC